MIVSFDKLNRFEEKSITLCNPDTTLDEQTNKLINSIGILNNYKNLSIDYNFNSQSTGSFDYTQNVGRSDEENQFFSTLYKSIVKDRYLFIENFGFVVITNVNTNNYDELKTKKINFTSCDKELENCEAPFLTTEETSTNTLEKFMTLWENCCPMWSVIYISDDLKKDENNNDIYRTITDITSENAYDFLLNEIQNAFDCVVDFDYINRGVCIYSQFEYTKQFQTTIHISKNLLNSLDIDENYDNSYTALEAVGDNNIELRMVNPTGNNIVYNFDSKLEWMPNDLQDKIKKWDKNIMDYKEIYYKLAPFWYQAQEDINNLYQDYLVASENLDEHMLLKSNIESSNDTDEIKNVALADVKNEIKIDRNGGYRKFEISRFIVDKVPKDESEWDSNKFYYYISDIDETPQWSYISSYNTWVNLSKVTPLYYIDKSVFNSKTYYLYDGKNYNSVNIYNKWNKTDTLFTYYYGLSQYGNKIGDDYTDSDSWGNGLMKTALTTKKNKYNGYSYKTLKEKINYINVECSLSTDSGLFNSKDLIRLSNYIKTGKYLDNSITVTDSMTYTEKADKAKELMNKTEIKLYNVINNVDKISIDVNKSFIFDVAFSSCANQLKSGCIINVETSDDVFEKIYLTSFSINYEEKTITFTLGNKYNKFDIKSLFDEVLGDISKSTSQIANLKKRINTLEKIIQDN